MTAPGRLATGQCSERWRSTADERFHPLLPLCEGAGRSSGRRPGRGGSERSGTASRAVGESVGLAALSEAHESQCSQLGST